MNAKRQTNDAAAAAAAEVTAKQYQSLYPCISPISSLELLQETFPPASPLPASSALSNPPWRLHGRDVLLVDVRTQPERDVSMILGAISLHDFTKDVLPALLTGEVHQSSNNSHTESLKDYDDYSESPKDLCRPGIIAMYCTIGFRSGMEAQKLLQKHPSMFIAQWNDDEKTDTERDIINASQERDSAPIRIGNLDGILTFANATLELLPKTGHQSQTLLVDHVTNQAAHRVHVYGTFWREYLSPSLGYEAKAFSNMEFSWRGIIALCRSCRIRCRGCWKW